MQYFLTKNKYMHCLCYESVTSRFLPILPCLYSGVTVAINILPIVNPYNNNITSKLNSNISMKYNCLLQVCYYNSLFLVVFSRRGSYGERRDISRVGNLDTHKTPCISAYSVGYSPLPPNYVLLSEHSG